MTQSCPSIPIFLGTLLCASSMALGAHAQGFREGNGGFEHSTPMREVRPMPQVPRSVQPARGYVVQGEPRAVAPQAVQPQAWQQHEHDHDHRRDGVVSQRFIYGYGLGYGSGYIDEGYVQDPDQQAAAPQDGTCVPMPAPGVPQVSYPAGTVFCGPVVTYSSP